LAVTAYDEIETLTDRVVRSEAERDANELGETWGGEFSESIPLFMCQFSSAAAVK
jgi:hypothetical protein